MSFLRGRHSPIRRSAGRDAASPRRSDGMLKKIGIELKHHAPFTAFGAVTGIAIITILVFARVPRAASETLFWTLHPLHVLLSALTTAAMYRLNSKGRLWATVVVGYLGSIGIATLSDSIIPYLGEWLLDLPHSEAHIGFIEKWWLVNPLAFLGITVACVWERTKVPHAGHVLLSTWASLFHMTMALGSDFTLPIAALITLFLFIAVWVPCCTSDIVFPLLCASGERSSPEPGSSTPISDGSSPP